MSTKKLPLRGLLPNLRKTCVVVTSLIFLFAQTLPALATNFTWNGATAQWNLNSNWLPASGYPDGNDDTATFNGTDTTSVTTPATALTIGALTIASGYTGTITLGSSLELDSAGGQTGTFDQDAGTFTTSGSHYAFTVDGAFDIDAGTFNANNSTITLNGTVWQVNNPGQFNAGGSTVIFANTTSNVNVQNPNNDDFNNLTQNNGVTMNLVNAVEIAGTFTTGDATATIQDDAGIPASIFLIMQPGSSMVNNGAVWTQNTSFGMRWYSTNDFPGGDYGGVALQFVAVAGTTALAGNITGTNYVQIMDLAGGTTTLDTAGFNITTPFLYVGHTTNTSRNGVLDCDTSTVDVAGDVNIFSGGGGNILQGGSCNFFVGDDWLNSDTFTAETSSVTFDAASGTNTLTSNGSAFYHLTIDDGDGGGDMIMQMSDALDVNGNLAITDGGLDVNGFNVTVAGDFTISTDGSLIEGSSTETVTFDGTQDQTITTDGEAFNNVVINNTGTAGSDDVIYNDNWDINGNLTITDGDLNPGANTIDLNLAGNWLMQTNGSFTPLNWLDDVFFDKTSGTQTVTSDGKAFYTFQATGGSTVELQDELTASTVNITAGSIDVKSGSDFTINVTGSSGFNCSGTGSFTARNGTVNFTYTAGAQTFAVGGLCNFNTINNQNTHASGLFMTSNATTANFISTTADSSLSILTGVTLTVTDTLTLTGTSGNEIDLVGVAGTGTIDVTGGAQIVDFVEVNGVHASTHNILARNSIDTSSDSGAAAPHFIFRNGPLPGGLISP